jgi:hypothetical protein
MAFIYQNGVFKDLTEKYPTWDQLKQYLESDEGGIFKVVDLQENGMCIIRYEKEVSNMTLPHSKWFRSVVWNTLTNRPVCVAPPKAASDKFLLSTIKEVQDAGIVCQELLDGFMINCFRVVNDKAIHIVSRSKFDAAGKFFSSKSFKEMFIESYCDKLNSGVCNEDVLKGDYDNMREPDVSREEAAVFYSFLVQHKEHRIVTKITQNNVTLIHKGIVFNDGHLEIEDTPAEFMGLSNTAYFPLVYSNSKVISGSYAKVVADGVSSESEVEAFIKKTMSDNTWEFQGIVFKDKQGNRWRFRSEKYNAVRSLLGNTPSLKDRYSQLYSQNLLDKYFEYFPEALEQMTPWIIYMSGIINTLYNYYVGLHITKTVKIDGIDKMWWPHLYALHGIFLTQLRPANKKINLNEIHLYIHKLPWQRVSFLLGKIEKTLNTSRHE